MKTLLHTKLLLFLIVASTLFAFKTINTDEIKGWYLTGSNAKNYQIGTETNAERNGKVAYLKSIATETGFGTIMQTFTATNYLGKRVKLTAYIKSNGVKDWAGMWFRIDGLKKEVLGFDNMQNRPIKGETGWTQYSIVLDVPDESKDIAYGVLLSGQGQIWIDDLKFEVVNKSVPITGTSTTITEPVNADFEEN